MLALTLAACLSPGGPVPLPEDDFARLTVEQATPLPGKTIRVKAYIVEPDDKHASIYSPDGNLLAVLWRKGEVTQDESAVVIEGRLKLVRAPTYPINGERAEAFWQLRIEEARQVG